MKTIPTVTCDRCGKHGTWISISGTNGMIAWSVDLCGLCFDEVKEMMLHRNRWDRGEKQ